MSYAISVLGGSVVINTVDGKVIYDVKAGTPTNTRVRLRGKGVPSIRDKNIRGDHYFTLVINTPSKVSKEAKELLKKYDELTGDTLNEAKRVQEAEKKENDSEKKEEKSSKKKKSFWKKND